MPTSNGLPPRELSLEKFPVKCEVKVGILLLEACLDKNIKKQFSQPKSSKPSNNRIHREHTYACWPFTLPGRNSSNLDNASYIIDATMEVEPRPEWMECDQTEIGNRLL